MPDSGEEPSAMADVRRIEVAKARAPEIREGILESISRVEGVTRVVCFPDVHQKPHKEIPSSVVVATRDTYVPNFSSVNQNCGMCYLQTDLAEADLDASALDRLAARIRSRVPGAKRDDVPVVDRETVERSVLEGASYACERFGLDGDALARLEDGGNCLDPSDGDARKLLDLIPDSVYEHGRRIFGHLGVGNHFIEVQSVSEIADPGACSAYGIEVGKVFLLYHTDSLDFGGQIGLFYGSRPLPGWKYAVKLAARKLAFHGPRLLQSEWWRAVFGRETFNPVGADTPVGRTLIAANHLNANFGYANRASIGKWLIDALSEFDPEADPRLFVDSNHNAIRRERIDGEDLWVHRHNAVRLLLPEDLPDASVFKPYGAPVILPGFYDTCSYLAIGRPEAARSLYSADHGGAKLMARMDDLGAGAPRVTRKYAYGSDAVREIPHRGNAGMEALIRTLDEEQVLRPLARLTPLATIKA
jgi:tRNA-splicing ligase RtcB